MARKKENIHDVREKLRIEKALHKEAQKRYAQVFKSHKQHIQNYHDDRQHLEKVLNVRQEKISDMYKHIESLSRALAIAATAFRYYETLHRAKIGGFQKAETNAAYAQIMESAIAPRIVPPTESEIWASMAQDQEKAE